MVKKQKKNLLAILGLISISATSVAGTCTSLYFGYKNYEKSSDFDKSYNLKIELNIKQTEDPWTQGTAIYPPITNYDDAVAKAKKTAEEYSKYYSLKNKADYPVYSEVIDMGAKTFRTFLNITVPNEKIKSTIEDDAKVDKSSSAIYYEYFNTPKISIIYSDADSQYYEYSQEYLTNTTWNNIKLGGDDKQQINIKLNDSFKNGGLEKIKEKFKPVKDDSIEYRPFMYVFKDQTGLINRMRYILSLDSKSDAFQLLDDSEKTFWSDAESFGWSRDEFNHLELKDPTGNTSGTKNLDYGSILVPTNKSGTVTSFIEDISVESDKPIIHTGNVKYEFVKKYLLGIIYQDKVSSESNDDTLPETYTSFFNFFPEKDPTDSKKDNDYQWMVVKQADPSGTKLTKFDADLLYNGIAKNKLDLPISTINIKDVVDNIIGTNDDQNSAKSIIPVNPSFDKNIFGMDSMAGALIAIGTIILILGIIVSVLYRIPGLISFLLVLLTLSLSFLTLSMVGYLISATLLCGLFVGFLAGMLIIVNSFERVKKEISIGYTTIVAVKRALAKTFMTIIDICAVTLLCGIGFVYIGAGQFLSLGVLMILISFLLFFIVFAGQFLAIFVLYKNDQLGLEKINYFTSKKSVVVFEPTTSFETTFRQKNTKVPFNLFNKTFLIIASVLMLGLIIAGLVVMFTIGDLNSFVFSGGSRIMIDEHYINDEFGGSINAFLSAIGGKWSSSGLNSGFWIINSPNNISRLEILDLIIKSGHGLPSQDSYLSIQEAIPNTFNVLTNSTLIMLFSVAGFMAAYSLIRFGWTSVIPMFIASFLAPGLTVLIFIAGQIFVNETIISAIAIGFIINNLLVFNLLGNIANRSVKKEQGDMNILKTIFNIQVWGSKFFFAIVALFIFVSLVAVGLFVSNLILSFVAIVFTTSILSILVCYLFVPQTYILFKSSSNKYLRRVNKIESRQEVYDKVDEQLIPGINVDGQPQ